MVKSCGKFPFVNISNLSLMTVMIIPCSQFHVSKQYSKEIFHCKQIPSLPPQLPKWLLWLLLCYIRPSSQTKFNDTAPFSNAYSNKV